MSREYVDYIYDIINEINRIEKFIEDQEFKEFYDDEKTSYAVVRSLEIMGEAAKNVPYEVREKYRDIPWRKMIGMRDKLIHGYTGVDLQIVWKTIKDDLPGIKPTLQKVIEDIEN